MNWDQYVKEAKRTQPSVEQYDKARAMLMINGYKNLTHLLGFISAIETMRITLGKLKKLIFSGKEVTFYSWEQHSHFLYNPMPRATLERIMDKLATPEGIATLHGAMGFADEALEVLDLVPDWLTTDADLSQKWVEESGDTLWYQAILYSSLGLNLPALCAGNVAKLAARWPDKFDPENVIRRDHALESGAMMEAIRQDQNADPARSLKGVMELEQLLKRIMALERSESELIDERDRAQEAANTLAYTIAPVEVIGEHSNMNDPWTEALEALDNERTSHKKECDEARSELEAVRLERDMANVEIRRLEQLLKEAKGAKKDEIGVEAPPARYNKEGRPECLDEIRMALGAHGFCDWLTGTIIKYAYRSGAKPGDIEKERFYRQLLDHVTSEEAGVRKVEDPRAYREGWTPREWKDDTPDGEWRDQQDAILHEYFPEYG